MSDVYQYDIIFNNKIVRSLIMSIARVTITMLSELSYIENKRIQLVVMISLPFVLFTTRAHVFLSIAIRGCTYYCTSASSMCWPVDAQSTATVGWLAGTELLFDGRCNGHDR